VLDTELMRFQDQCRQGEHMQEQSAHNRVPTRCGRKERKDGLLTTGDMARLSHNTLRTVRFYEEENILRPTLRSEGGHRLFARSELDRLLLVTDMRAAGLSLDEIKTILELRRSSKSGAQASKKASEFLEAQTGAMRKKIIVLQRLQEDFELATRVFSGCKHCENEDRYPSQCKLCGVMRKPSDLPRTVRVLWGVGPSE
jgi:DNA-binding transcriptional MerR regulator